MFPGGTLRALFVSGARLRSSYSLFIGEGLSRRLFHGDTSEAGRMSDSGFVHPMAIVHPDAVLGQGVNIGPFCTIGPHAKIGDACQLQAGIHISGDTQIGAHCDVQSGAIIGADLPGQTVIGSNNIIGQHAVVGVRCQDLKYKPGDECFLYIGNHNDIREHSSIHRSSKSSDKTVIGDNNLIMGSCHIAHDCKIGNNNIFANNTLLAGHVVIEDHTHTAGAVVIHQFCHIGAYSFIGGGSVIAQDVPKYMMVSGDRAELRGLNLEGLRRHGFSTTEVRNLRKAYQKIFMPSSTNSGTFDDRLNEVGAEMAPFHVVSAMVQSIRESFDLNRRGICKFRNWTGL